MRNVHDRVHGWLDYAAVLFLAIAPASFGFSGRVAALFYVMAMVQLALTLATDFGAGVVRYLRFPSHGAIEAGIAALFLVAPWGMGFAHVAEARNVSIAFGLLLGALWVATDYHHVDVPVYERETFGRTSVT